MKINFSFEAFKTFSFKNHKEAKISPTAFYLFGFQADISNQLINNSNFENFRTSSVESIYVLSSVSSLIISSLYAFLFDVNNDNRTEKKNVKECNDDEKITKIFTEYLHIIHEEIFETILPSFPAGVRYVGLVILIKNEKEICNNNFDAKNIQKLININKDLCSYYSNDPLLGNTFLSSTSNFSFDPLLFFFYESSFEKCKIYNLIHSGKIEIVECNGCILNMECIQQFMSVHTVEDKVIDNLQICNLRNYIENFYLCWSRFFLNKTFCLYFNEEDIEYKKLKKYINKLNDEQSYDCNFSEINTLILTPKIIQKIIFFLENLEKIILEGNSNQFGFLLPNNYNILSDSELDKNITLDDFFIQKRTKKEEIETIKNFKDENIKNFPSKPCFDNLIKVVKIFSVCFPFSVTENKEDIEGVKTAQEESNFSNLKNKMFTYSLRKNMNERKNKNGAAVSCNNSLFFISIKFKLDVQFLSNKTHSLKNILFELRMALSYKIKLLAKTLILMCNKNKIFHASFSPLTPSIPSINSKFFLSLKQGSQVLCPLYNNIYVPFLNLIDDKHNMSHICVNFCSNTFINQDCILPLTLISSKLSFTRYIYLQRFIQHLKPVFRKCCSLIWKEKNGKALIDQNDGNPFKLIDYKTLNLHGKFSIGPRWISTSHRKCFTLMGNILYYHYNQGGIIDNGWGCCYRSLQTIISWYKLQGYTDADVPSIRQIQELLRKNDVAHERLKIGEPIWIGTVEGQYILNWYLGFECKVIYLQKIEDILLYTNVFEEHFTFQGTPIIMGICNYAYTMIGICSDICGETNYLILDPHYVGNEDIKFVIDKGWIAWKKFDFLVKTAKGKFVNLCLPQTRKEDSSFVY